ncbi:uncharacterized protein PFL1_03278 [Pseudozyma flocculosa PF-1]|uniref:F-box domain-containing protein n=1 Tax=Pseudozyma flocculosa PF-1 TaxID=1277687 RepID=A0A061H8P5_9BASI|nr:uncharacterized protein PFL1_03278 [Pseudozyma flocculosa PF-1]EPQ28988.1 hypothetical protein PFL1_03278 [Pseudozyma flocculosa PF-1]
MISAQIGGLHGENEDLRLTSGNFRDRFLSSRLARRLHISGARQAGDGDVAPRSSDPLTLQGSPGDIRRPHQRIPFVRSDSAPEPPRLNRRRVEVRSFAATNYVQGAVMGPTSGRARSRRPSSSANVRRGPSTLDSVPMRSTRGPSSATPPTTSVLSERSTAAAVSTVDGRASQGNSRPHSRAASYAGGSGGLFTCGYTSSVRSGASTPMRQARSNKSRSVSLRDLSDRLLHRDRDHNHGHDSETDGGHQRDAADLGSAAEPTHASEEMIATTAPATPPDAEASVPASASNHERPAGETSESPPQYPVAHNERPSWLYPVNSVPHASVVIEAAEPCGPISLLPSATPCHFAKLPRELALLCFESLIGLHINEHLQQIEDGAWRGSIAFGRRWVGVQSAMRELIRLRRVSRQWQDYVLDGQLWHSLELPSFPHMSAACLHRIARAAGPFVKTLDLRGSSGLASHPMPSLSGAGQHGGMTSAGAGSTPPSITWSSLVELNLQGCRNLSSSSLADFLRSTPGLRALDLGGLDCVTDGTCRTISETLTALEQLDISRCANVTDAGIAALVASPGPSSPPFGGCPRDTASSFRIFRAAGVTTPAPETMSSIGKRWPNLEELDLSHTDLDNACIASWVSSWGDSRRGKDADVTPVAATDNGDVRDSAYHIALTPRQAGSLEDEGPIHRRTFPRLVKLKLGSCPRLTDVAASHLAWALPSLEVLELSSAGGAQDQRIRDAGLLRLLPSVPRLRRLDLEGASTISDRVLAALTPPPSCVEVNGAAVPPEGVAAASGSLRLNRLRRQQGRGAVSDPVEGALPSPSSDIAAGAALIPVTGTQLTHLVLSSAKQLSVAAIILLIRGCPNLHHLELDDTEAGDAVAREFVLLARRRKAQGAHLTLIDCRGLTRSTNLELAHLESVEGSAGTRPRAGRRGWTFRHFRYDDADAAAIESSRAARVVQSGADMDTEIAGVVDASGRQDTLTSSDPRRTNGTAAHTSTAALRAVLGQDECNADRVVLKNYYAWESVQTRARARDAGRSSRGRSSTTAAAPPRDPNDGGEDTNVR